MKLPRLLTHATSQTATSLSAIVLAAVAFVAVPYASAQTYFNLAAGNFTETFSTISSNTTWATPSSGSWSGFASNATAPATGLPDPTKTTASSLSFTSGTAGGIQRGSAQTPATESLVFLSAGSNSTSSAIPTSSTAIDLLLNFTNRIAGSLTFDAGSVANSTGNRTGTLRVYSSPDGSSWNELTGTDLPFVVENNVSKNATISLPLPSSLNNQAQAKLRFYYNNGGASAIPSPGGNRPKISIDNLLVTSTSSISGLPVISSSSNATVTANSAFSYTIVASNSPSSYGATPLPPGLTLSGNVISGTPTTPGSYNITLSATNGNGTGQAALALTVGIDPNAPVVASGQVIAAEINQPLTGYQIQATSPLTPVTYSSGPLPAGLTLNATTGVISGTPTVAGPFINISLTASNSAGLGTSNATINISSPPITTSALSLSVYLTSNFTYTLGVDERVNTLQNAVWTDLPAGVTNTTAKVVAGTPTATGDYSMQFSIENDAPTNKTTNGTVSLKVIDQAAQDAIPTSVVINKYVNGTPDNSTPDKVELLVVGTGVAGSTADLRGMIIKDFSGSIAGDNGGQFTFTTNSLWSAVPAGTLIVLTSGNSGIEDTSYSGDFVLRINLGNTTYFTGYGSFDIATAEMLMIKAAGHGSLGVAGGIHALASTNGGNVTTMLYTSYTGKKLLATGSTGTNLGVIVNNPNSNLNDYNGGNATAAIAAASLNFGAANNPTNQTFIDSLRTAPLSNNANLSNLVISSGTLAPLFSAGTTSYTATVANSVGSITVTPSVQDGNATVKVNNTTVVSGSPSSAISLNVGNNTISTVVTAQDLTTTKTYTLTVTRLAPAITIWRDSNFPPAGNSTATTGPGADAADFDGDGVSNLLEYIAGTNPTVASANPVVSGTTTVSTDTFLTLTYPRHPTDTTITYSVLGSTDLTTAFVATTGNTTISGGNATYTDNVPLNASNPRRFLRLQVGNPAP